MPEETLDPLNGTSLSAMEADYFQALAVGDRLRAGGILKRLREALGNVDPDKLKNGLDLITKLIGLFPASEAPVAQSADAIAMLSADDVHAAGIFDNPQLWLTVLHAIMELIRQLRGEAVALHMAAVANDAKHETKSKKHSD